MKKIAIIFASSIFFSITLLVFIAIFKPAKQPSLMDCLEFGICAEGTKLKENEKEYIVTKDYCLKNNLKWDNNNSVCNIRKTND